MGCGCGKKGTPNVGGTASKSTSGQYALTLPSGERKFFATEAEARAANRAAGNKGLIRRVS